MSGFTELVKIIAVTSSTDDCIVWPGAKYDNGYGCITVDGKQWTAHRYVKMVADGLSAPPKGMVCRHDCDNPPCINPRHLLWGTNQDNSDDKVSRGRHAHGERVAGAKMTDDLVTAAREFFLHSRSLKKTEKKFDLRTNSCRQMLLGKTWGHVPGAISEQLFNEIVRRSIPEAEVSEIITRRKSGQSWQKIADEMNYGSAMTPLRIYRRSQ